MARTPLAQRIEDAYAEVVESRTTRRELVKRTAAVGAAVAGASTMGRFAKAAHAAGQPQIAVVGAGLAGLTCAYRLQQAGYNATVYEAHPDRIGGRCWSMKFADGQIAEHGGELIDQSHTAMRQLTQELGFTLDNLLQAQPKGTEDFFYVNGAKYTYTQVVADLNGIYQKMHKDVSAASYPTLWNLYTQRGWELDHMSIIDWLNETVPGGAGSNLGRVLDIAYNIEYGAECSEQSALNLLYLIGYSGQGQFRVFGPSNEKYHVKGGNDQVSTELGRRLAGQIKPDHVLSSIKQNSGGSFTLTFQNGATTRTATVDRVVLAIPFSMLRSVNYSKAGFAPLKVTAIKELQMGTNSKLHVQFKNRFWYGARNNGNTYADTGYQNTWEVTRAQNGAKGILVDYTGGRIGASFGSGTPEERAKQFLGQLAPQFPGVNLSQQWDGSAASVAVDYWAGYPWTKGSYSYWRVGQYTKFSGMEKERQGNCHFAGEHTSQDFQGYLNGGVESGERAAGEILGDLKR
ncbi:MAG: monoamine oxidase [Gaiellaceae bacterium]|nr:monoamine oxidase [Gaiellaceae bacterium]